MYGEGIRELWLDWSMLVGWPLRLWGGCTFDGGMDGGDEEYGGCTSLQMLSFMEENEDAGKFDSRFDS